MSRSQGERGMDLRGFRWSLLPLERKLEAELEAARLAMTRLQQQSQALEQTEERRRVQQREEERFALQAAKRNVLAGAQAMRYLAHLEAGRIAAQALRAELRQRVAVAREQCAERQRQLESVQALRRRAQQAHAQERLRREWREADAAWLALDQLRAAGLRNEERAP